MSSVSLRHFQLYFRMQRAWLGTGALAFSLVLSAASPSEAVSQRVTGGSRDLVNLTLTGRPIGGVPPGFRLLDGTVALRLVDGTVDVVDKDGQRMLRASSRSTFLLSLPEVLPQDFTVEFDMVPKECCNPEDIGFEGTMAINQGAYSSNVLLHREHLRAVGGGATFDQRIPEAIAVSLPGSLTEVVFGVQGETITLYINGQLAHTMTNRKFARGRVLRVFLGGQNDTDQAVYLARFRVAAGTVSTAVVTAAVTANPAIASGTVPGTTAPVPLTAAPVNNTATATATTQPTAPSGPLTPPTRTPMTPTALGTAPAPTNLMVSGWPNTAYLSWNAVAGAVGYSVKRALVGTMSASTLTSANITATRFGADVLPDPTKTYTYTVLAYQADGTYGQASVDYTPPKPADPIGFTATSPQPGTVSLSWQASAPQYLVTGPGVAPNVTIFGTTFVVSGVPRGLHTYRVASVYPPGGTMTPPATWSSTSVSVAPLPSVPFLTVPNGQGSLAEYNRHACAAGQWLSGQQPWVNGWCGLPTPTSVAAVEAWPLLGLFGIEEFQPRMGKPLVGVGIFDIYLPANEFTQFSTWRWAQGNRVVPEASFHDDTDLDRGRRVGCVQRGAGAAAATMCWAASNPGVLSVIVQSQLETSFLLFQDTPYQRQYTTDCPDPPRWWDEPNGQPISCGKLLGVPSTVLDSKGSRFAPHACIACHGGKFDPATGKVTGATLLPLDPRGFTFPSTSSRGAQEETIRQINMMIFNSQASTLVRNYITDMYRGRQTVLGAVVDDAYVPPAWASQPAVYRDVYRPYCASCHNAQTGTLGFSGWADLVREKVRVQHSVCNARTMPHAEVPFNKFWNDGTAAKWPNVLMSALGLPRCP